MGSNFNMDFDTMVSKHFTCAELVEFLNLTTQDILDKFEDVIDENYDEVLEEIGGRSNEG